MIERDAPAALQAVALLGRDNSTRRIGETIEPDVGIGHLDLRRDAELAADGRALAHFDAERLTATVIALRSEEHTSELQSLMRISYAVFCLKKKTTRHAQCIH